MKSDLQSMKSDCAVHEEWLAEHEEWLQYTKSDFQNMKCDLQKMKSDCAEHEEWLCRTWRVTVQYMKSYCAVHEEWLCRTWRVTCRTRRVTVQYMKSDSSLFLDHLPRNYLSVDSTAVATSSLTVAGKLEVLAGADRYRGRWLRAREIGWSKRRHHPGIYCHLLYPLMCRTFVIL